MSLSTFVPLWKVSRRLKYLWLFPPVNKWIDNFKPSGGLEHFSTPERSVCRPLQKLQTHTFLAKVVFELRAKQEVLHWRGTTVPHQGSLSYRSHDLLKRGGGVGSVQYWAPPPSSLVGPRCLMIAGEGKLLFGGKQWSVPKRKVRKVLWRERSNESGLRMPEQAMQNQGKQ